MHQLGKSYLVGNVFESQNKAPSDLRTGFKVINLTYLEKRFQSKIFSTSN